MYYSGFTTAMPPNQTVSTVSRAIGYSNAGQILPMDWDWIDENDGGPTYMSLSASSYHPGGVNALFADGSVHFVKNSINPVTWYALGTIAGGEVDQRRSVLSGSRHWTFSRRPRATPLRSGVLEVSVSRLDQGLAFYKLLENTHAHSLIPVDRPLRPARLSAGGVGLRTSGRPSFPT